MDDKPIVSVILVAFNEERRLIEESIESILRQTFRDFELLIIDDSTNHQTIEVIDEKSGLDNRIKVLRTNKNKYFSKALNYGLRNAVGKYIARMDPDDISHESRLQLQVSFLEKNHSYSIIGSAIKIINENGLVISSRKYPKSPIMLKLWSLFRNPLAHPTVMMRRDIIDQGFLYDEEFAKAEDLELWLRLMKNNYKIYNLQESLLKYRLIGNYSDKRFGENFEYNFRARRKNFSWRRPVSGLISLAFAKMYNLLPKSFIDTVYKFTK